MGNYSSTLPNLAIFRTPNVDVSEIANGIRADLDELQSCTRGEILIAAGLKSHPRHFDQVTSQLEYVDDNTLVRLIMALKWGKYWTRYSATKLGELWKPTLAVKR